MLLDHCVAQSMHKLTLVQHAHSKLSSYTLLAVVALAAGATGGCIKGDTDSSVTVDNCSFLKCTTSDGAAIHNSGELTVTASSFHGNTGMSEHKPVTAMP
eukprot:7203-Heterococcus_DN1.PRE.3